MKFIWLTIWLTILSPDWTTAQIGLNTDREKVIFETTEMGLQVVQPPVRGYWAYRSNIRWDGIEVLGDSVLNITYDFAKITYFIYSACQPDSVMVTPEIGSGIYEAVNIAWKKGYNAGIEKGAPTTWDKISYGFCGAAVVFGIITTVDIIRN